MCSSANKTNNTKAVLPLVIGWFHQQNGHVTSIVDVCIINDTKRYGANRPEGALSKRRFDHEIVHGAFHLMDDFMVIVYSGRNVMLPPVNTHSTSQTCFEYTIYEYKYEYCYWLGYEYLELEYEYSWSEYNYEYIKVLSLFHKIQPHL